MLNKLVQRVRDYRPTLSASLPDLPEAAVLLPVTRSEAPRVIFTLRASGLSTHSGEVAFPGGRRDPQDRDLVETALREAEEEVALAPDQVELLGQLSTLVSRHRIQVTPYVGLVPDNFCYRANEAEIAAVFSAPLAYFGDDPRQGTHRIEFLGRSWYVPSYQYGGYQIWGLSAIILVELVNLVYDTGIDMHRPPANFICL